MSKKKARREAQESSGGPSHDAPELPPPDPPRPNKVFLGITVALFVAWLAFLLWLALAT